MRDKEQIKDHHGRLLCPGQIPIGLGGGNRQQMLV